MKKCVSLLLLTMMLLSSLSGLAFAAEAPIVLWEEKFDAKAVGDLAGSAKDGYTVKERASGNNMAVIDKEFKDKAAFNSYQYASYSIPSAKTGGKASFEYEYKPDSASNDSLCVYLIGADSDDAGQKNAPFPYITTFVSATELRCQFTAEGSPISLGGAKDFVKIKYDIDLDAHTYDVYLNGTLKGKKWPFREAALMASAYSAPSPINGGVTMKTVSIMNPGAASDGPFFAKYAFDNFVYSATDGKGVSAASTTGTTVPAAPVVTAKPVAPAATVIGTSEGVIPTFDHADADLKTKMEGAVALVVDTPMARVGNKYSLIDKDNPNVSPFVFGGRTLVPVRFIAEAFGANVGWDEATQTIFVKSGAANVEMVLGSDKMKVSGVEKTLDVAANTYNDRTFIPLRAMVEAMGKKVFWDDRGLIVIADGSPIAEQDETLISYSIKKIKDEAAAQAGGRYSDVYMSSRWFRPDGRDGQWGTLDAMKRFMATGEKWAYIPEAKDIKSITDLGLTFQIAMNANMSPDAQDFDGNPIIAPWMVSWGAKWACVNSPTYVEYMKNYAKTAIDNGVTEFQYDDWNINYATMNWTGGCFCEHCMKAFTIYLKDKYIADDFVKWNIKDINTFNFKTYLGEKYQVKTKADLLAKKATIPLMTVYADFSLDAVRVHHQNLMNDMTQYAGRPLLYSHNLYGGGSVYGKKDYTFISDIANGAMGETPEAGMETGAILTTSLVTKSTGRPYVMSPLPESDHAIGIMKNAIPACYATGQFMLVPWDTYVNNAPRYFGSTEMLEGLFWFVRQYPELFDQYELPHGAGLLVNLNKQSTFGLKELALDLFRRGIPYTGVVSQKGIPAYDITEKQLKNVKVIIESSPVSELVAKEQEVIAKSGVKVVGIDNLDAIQSEMWTVKVAGDNEKIYATLRTKTDENAPKVVHVLNETGFMQNDISIEVSGKYLFGGANVSAYLYRPGYNPQQIGVTQKNGNIVMTLPPVDRWGIIKIIKEGTEAGGLYPLGKEWSGINLGTRSSEDKGFGEGDGFKMIARGLGLGVNTAADTTGTQDQVSFIYKNLPAGAARNYFASAKIESQDGIAGVMLRKDPTANAQFVALTYQSDKGLRLAYRSEINKAVTFTDLGKTKPAYVKLQREGNQIVAYTSANGQSYDVVGKAPLAFDVALGGILAASGVASKVEVVMSQVKAEVVDFASSDAISKIEIKAPAQLEKGKKYTLDIVMTTKSGKTLGLSDADVSITSSNREVLLVDNKGRMVAKSDGQADITVKVTAAGSSAEQKASFSIIKPNPTIFTENFDSYPEGAAPASMKGNNDGIKIAKEGTGKKIVISSKTEGQTSDVMLAIPVQEGKVALEFDFKANFGANTTDTGARVVYLGSMNISLTATPKGFSYFFGKDQKEIAPITQDKWHKVKLIIDYTSRKVDVYIDGAKVVDQGIFREEGPPASSMQLGGWRVCPDVSYEWDNIVYSLAD